MNKQTLRAFSLIELLTVIAIIAVLAAILIPAIGAVRSSANTATCSSNLRSISQAMLLYVADRSKFGSNGVSPDDDTKVWDLEILPYLGYTENQVDAMGEGPASRDDANDAFVAGIADVFACPEDEVVRSNPLQYKRSYSIVPWTYNWAPPSAPEVGRPANRGIPAVALKNPASAALFIEWHSVGNCIGALSYSSAHHPQSSEHQGKTNVAFADGHVETLDMKSMTNQEFIQKHYGDI